MQRSRCWQSKAGPIRPRPGSARSVCASNRGESRSTAARDQLERGTLPDNALPPLRTFPMHVISQAAAGNRPMVVSVPALTCECALATYREATGRRRRPSLPVCPELRRRSTHSKGARMKRPNTQAMDKWHFTDQGNGTWRWALRSAESTILRASAEAYASRPAAVKNARQYGYAGD